MEKEKMEKINLAILRRKSGKSNVFWEQNKEAIALLYDKGVSINGQYQILKEILDGNLDISFSAYRLLLIDKLGYVPKKENYDKYFKSKKKQQQEKKEVCPVLESPPPRPSEVPKKSDAQKPPKKEYVNIVDEINETFDKILSETKEEW